MIVHTYTEAVETENYHIEMIMHLNGNKDRIFLSLQPDFAEAIAEAHGNNSFECFFFAILRSFAS